MAEGWMSLEVQHQAGRRLILDELEVPSRGLNFDAAPHYPNRQQQEETAHSRMHRLRIGRICRSGLRLPMEPRPPTPVRVTFANLCCRTSC